MAIDTRFPAGMTSYLYIFIVPTLCVGMLQETLSVSHRWSDTGFIPALEHGNDAKT